MSNYYRVKLTIRHGYDSQTSVDYTLQADSVPDAVTKAVGNFIDGHSTVIEWTQCNGEIIPTCFEVNNAFVYFDDTIDFTQAITVVPEDTYMRLVGAPTLPLEEVNHE